MKWRAVFQGFLYAFQESVYLAENVVLQHVFTRVGGLSGCLTAFTQCPPPPQLYVGSWQALHFPIDGEHLRRALELRLLPGARGY